MLSRTAWIEFDEYEGIGIDGITAEVLDGSSQRLLRWELQREARRLLPKERVSRCLRLRRSGILPVFVYRRDADHSTYFANLTVCGLPWVCPICAAKISERRRVELVQGVDTWKARGGSLAFVTLTVPHCAGSAPLELVNDLMRLVERFNSGAGRLSALVPGYVGQVRALEVTYGDSGWHPHCHVLVFCDQTPDLEALHRSLWASWRGLVTRFGLGTPSERAFSVQDGTRAAKYASKWGLPEEMAKGHFKTARSARGHTPFSLLSASASGDREAGVLFQKFAAAFKGRRQLRWSAKLRALLGIGADRTDQEQAATIDAMDELRATIGEARWRLVCEAGLRGVVLEICREGSQRDLDAFFEGLGATG